MDNLNLNSDAYNDNELEKILRLPASYNVQDLDKAKQILTKSMGNRNHLESEKKREISFFLDTITLRLRNRLNAADENHTVIQQGSNFIIENPDRLIGKKAQIDKGRIALESQSAPPGYLNPINVRTITQAISIDSRFRPNYYATKSTNFSIVLPAIQKNVVSLRVSSIELPTTYYAVSRNNGNSTCLFIDLNDPEKGWLLTLPDGNYEQSWAENSNAASIEKALNDAIAKALPVALDEGGYATPNPSGTTLTAADLTYNLDRISGKSFFTAVAGGIFATDGFIVRFNVDNEGSLNLETNLQMKLGWQLGFRAAEYLANPSCVSEGICLVCGPRYGFVSIDDHQKNTGPSFIVAYANSILQDNIITRINLAELQADVGVYQSSSDPGLSTQLNRMREYFGPVDIQRLHISLYDEFGRIIDLNNMDWSIMLVFEVLYN